MRFSNPITGYFRRFVYQVDLPEQENLRRRLLFYWSVVSVAAIFGLTALAWFLDVGVLFRYGWALLAQYAVLFFVLPLFSRFDLAHYALLAGLILTTFLFILWCGGLLHSGGLIFVGLTCALSSVLLNSLAGSIATFALYLVTLIGCVILEPRLSVHPDLPPRVNYLFFVLNIGWMSTAQMLFIVYYIRERAALDAAESRRLQEMDGLKTRLFTQITHEFRTPLTLILGMADRVRDAGGSLAEAGQMIGAQGRRLLRLVEQMLGLARVESGAVRLWYVQGDILLFLRYLVEPFAVEAWHRDIDFRFSCRQEALAMDFDPEKLEMVVGNLLTNALKHTPAGGAIEVTAWQDTDSAARPPQTEGWFFLSVRDTGEGIPAEDLPRIFDRFFQVGSAQGPPAEGTGLGLAIVREYMRLMGGEVTVKSAPGEGAQFTLRLPIRRRSPKRWRAAGPPAAEKENGSPAQDPLPTASTAEKPLLLVVEDNPDVVQYLRSLLEPGYEVISANHGREGWALAFERVPDIILSDIMMPEMDGFALLKEVRSHVETSHIPVVLLSARADQASRLEGLELGADAYLSKPFQREELFVRLRKLLEQRRALQTRYAAPAPADSPIAAGNDPEQAFLDQVNAALEQNLDDEKYGIQDLARQLGMSRTQLYRKFRALTDTTVHRHLRRYRLHRARELLQQGELNVTQVALEVGLPNLSSFSRAFSEEFGLNPSQVRPS